MITVHVTGNFTQKNKKTINSALGSCCGQYLDDTDKGSLFGFSTLDNAELFSNAIAQIRDMDCKIDSDEYDL